MTINHVMIEGVMFEVKNIPLDAYNVAQIATLLFNMGHAHIRVLGTPSIKVAFVNNKPCVIGGILHGDHIEVQTLEYKEKQQ